MSSRSIFLIGVFVTLLVVKPGFGTAVLASLGNVAGAAFDSPAHAAVPPPPPQPIPVNTVGESEEVVNAATERMDRFESKTEQILNAIASILERMDRIESRNEKREEQQPAEVESPKRQAYNRALQLQAEQERMAGYDGNDPTVRSRYNLPPKVPPFDLFMVDGEMDVSQFDREYAKRRAF